MKKMILLLGTAACFSCGSDHDKDSELAEKMIGVWTRDSIVRIWGDKTMGNAVEGGERIALDDKGRFRYLGGGGCLPILETGRYFVEKNPKRPFFTVLYLPDTEVWQGNDTIIPSVRHTDFKMLNDSEFVTFEFDSYRKDDQWHRSEVRSFYRKTGTFK
ncbi:MAG: hypothetical protein ACKOXB_10295 [Flavobacteriales bacterium]